MGAEAVRAVICDVDGVLTDGGIILCDDGTEAKRFHVWDGTGIKYLLRSGIEVAFLTGRESAVVVRRAGFAVAVGNAREEVRAEADHVTSAPGGQGAIRELAELILTAQGKWGAVVARYGLEVAR